MDPNECLSRIRQVSARIQQTIDAGRMPDTHDAGTLASLATALDEWITRGGFLPAEWEKKR